jgi:4,5-dihydroxyphthalate decarboxylase
MNVIACPEEAMKNRLGEARQVFDAFVRAKEIGLAGLRSNRSSGLFWYWEALEDQLELLGDDPVPYSVSKNRPMLDTLLTYCAEQGLVDRKLAIEELFFSGFDS